jgi:hypothetical protein
MIGEGGKGGLLLVFPRRLLLMVAFFEAVLMIAFASDAVISEIVGWMNLPTSPYRG